MMHCDNWLICRIFVVRLHFVEFVGLNVVIFSVLIGVRRMEYYFLVDGVFCCCGVNRI